MTADFPVSIAPDSNPDWHEQALAHLSCGEYAAAAAAWQEEIAALPDRVEAYWYLGIALLLQGEEAEAQMSWMTPLLDANPVQAEQWLAELAEILQAEAARQEASGADETAWLVRQHLRELCPELLENLLRLLLLDLKLDRLAIDEGFAPVRQALAASSPCPVSTELLLQVIDQLLSVDPAHSEVLELIEAIASGWADPLPIVQVLQRKADELLKASQARSAAALGKLCLRLMPDNLELLPAVIPMLQLSDGDERHSIELAERYLASASTPEERVLACQHLLAGLMTVGGQWQRVCEVYQTHQALLRQIAQTPSDRTAAPELLVQFLKAGIYFFYVEDNPSQNRPLRNQIGAIAQTHTRAYVGKPPYVFRPREAARLKVGYLSESLRRHSVGWLIRWLLMHHDRDRFDVHLYSCRYTADPLQTALAEEYGDRFHSLTVSAEQVAEQIYRDEIDVLIELDSLTSLKGCAVSALKPAPVQVNWLGFDAAGLPAIDYFIADPYVLPETAQDYYSEKIWRLPSTYIAVDGFETSAPSLRRDRLEIPSDAIVYFSSQTGLKRNPDNARLQMQILRAVPNSYFLIKSIKSDPEALQAFFYELAAEAGVSGDRLRFLSRENSEAVHRGNLSLADIVLDTFPYTGATTTMEALWVGLPLVTRVGEQFAARNSYTMLMNVGVTEGIAWTDAEYVEWGIRLGKDEALRQQVSWKLRRSRHTSPLWNAKQFTQDMETAYTQMWQRYREAHA